MRLTKFRITHYKSIIDSGWSTLADDFTVLVGKNESGKTAILEALRDFDREQYVVPESAYPLSAIQAEEPKLEMIFETTQEELDAIEKETGILIKEEVRQYILKEGFHLNKLALGEYKLESEFLNQLLDDISPKEADEELSHIQVKLKNLEELIPGGMLPDLVLDKDDDALDQSVQKITSSVKSKLLMISDEVKRNEAVELLRGIIRDANNSENRKIKLSVRGNFLDSIVQRLPRFVFFSDFQDILPFKIPYNSLSENRAVQDFSRIAQLNLEEAMKIDDVQRRINLFNRHTAKISGDFLGQWEQNQIELVVRPEGDSLLFGVKETGRTDFFKVEQRSKGFQWFLSFYLKLNSYELNNVVVLIDEPGINLHPVAQQDILKLFKKKSSQSMQFVFSTHSPALLEIDRLDRIRLVVKDKESGTIVENSLNENVDQETLIPIKMALASQVSIEIPSVLNREEIVVEEQPEIEVKEEIVEFDVVQENKDVLQEATEVVENVSSISEEVEQETELNESVEEDMGGLTDEPQEELEMAAVAPIDVEEKPKKKGLFGWFK